MTANDNPWSVWERNFIEQMARLREARQMTQTDLARELKVGYGLSFHQQTVQRIEAGERPVRLNEAHLIAKVLGVDVETMTSTSAQPDREMRYVVGRLRRSSESTAEALSAIIMEWLEDVEAFTFTLSERLKANEDQPDNVTIWGLAWAEKILSTYDDLHDAWQNLGLIHGRPTQIAEEEEWEMTLPRDDIIEALTTLVDQYTNKRIRDLAVCTPRELWAEFPGDDESWGEEPEGREVLSDEEFLTSVRNGFRTPHGPQADIDDLQGFTSKELEKLTRILGSRYATGESLWTLSGETNLLPVAICQLLKDSGDFVIREEDIKQFRRFDEEGGE